jgi:hypothetical protein
MRLVEQMSKWFYDTFTGTATGATRCGSLLEGLRSLELTAMEEARWTRGFTWFRPPEHNTLHQWRGLLYCSVFFKLALNWPEWTCLYLSSARPFIAQGRGSNIMT